MLPAIFVGWGLYFLLGANGAALGKTAIAAPTGTRVRHDHDDHRPGDGRRARLLGPRAVDRHHRGGARRALDHRRGRSLRPRAGVRCYASVFFWWIATGLDNYVPDGKGPHTAAAITRAITNKPLANGTGAFGGLISMSWPWVGVSVFVSLVVGSLFGVVSVQLAGVLGRIGAKPAADEPPRSAEHAPRPPRRPPARPRPACGGRAGAGRPRSGRAVADRRRAAARRALGSGQRDHRPGQLEQRQRAAADPRDGLDDLAPPISAASALRRARRAATPRASPAPGSLGARRSRCSRSVASSAASESLSIRSARASGCARAAATASARPTISPACGPPSSLSPQKQTSAAPAATERRTSGSSCSVDQRAGADVVDHRHAELAQRLDRHVLDEPELAEVRLVHAQDRARRPAPSGALVVREPRPVGGPDLDQPRARLRDHVRHAEAAADLHQLPARDHDLAAGPPPPPPPAAPRPRRC